MNFSQIKGGRGRFSFTNFVSSTTKKIDGFMLRLI